MFENVFTNNAKCLSQCEVHLLWWMSFVMVVRGCFLETWSSKAQLCASWSCYRWREARRSVVQSQVQCQQHNAASVRLRCCGVTP